MYSTLYSFFMRLFDSLLPVSRRIMYWLSGEVMLFNSIEVNVFSLLFGTGLLAFLTVKIALSWIP